MSRNPNLFDVEPEDDGDVDPLEIDDFSDFTINDLTKFSNSVEQSVYHASQDERVQYKFLSKYEYTKIKSIRLQQLAAGAIPYVIVDTNQDIYKIFQREFTEKKLPFIIKRKINAMKYEFIRLKDMIYLDKTLFSA